MSNGPVSNLFYANATFSLIYLGLTENTALYTPINPAT